MISLFEKEFFSNLLGELSLKFGIKYISLFYHDKSKGILKAILRLRFDMMGEYSETLWVKSSMQFFDSMISYASFYSKNGKCVYLYMPYRIEKNIKTEGSNNMEYDIVFRFERFDGKKFKKGEILKADKFIRQKLEEYDKVIFENLKYLYSRNINVAASLGSLFARSIREKESFKLIIKSLQNLFGFDRVRLYRVIEEKKILKGLYSIDRTNRVKDISYDTLVLKQGYSTLVDILLSNDELFIKDNIIYLPLEIDYRKVGLLVVDNLLSGLNINLQTVELLKSFSNLIALAIENIILFEKIQEMSMYDELTKLALRRYFNQRFQEEFYRAERFKQPLSVLWIDIDMFKEINDSFGHQIGDVVLREISRTILNNLRKIDFPCRYGGDEIVILLPQSDEKDALGLAKRLMDEIKKIHIDLREYDIHHRELKLSVSIGIASYPKDAKTMDELLNKADEALYWVKSHGRDGVKVYSELNLENSQKS